MQLIALATINLSHFSPSELVPSKYPFSTNPLDNCMPPSPLFVEIKYELTLQEIRKSLSRRSFVRAYILFSCPSQYISSSWYISLYTSMNKPHRSPWTYIFYSGNYAAYYYASHYPSLKFGPVLITCVLTYKHPVMQSQMNNESFLICYLNSPGTGPRWSYWMGCKISSVAIKVKKIHSHF